MRPRTVLPIETSKNAFLHVPCFHPLFPPHLLFFPLLALRGEELFVSIQRSRRPSHVHSFRHLHAHSAVWLLFFQPTLAKLPSRTSVRPIAAKHERVAPLGRLARSTTFIRGIQDIILPPFSNHCTGVFGVQIVRQTAFTTDFISVLYPWSLSLFFFTFFCNYCSITLDIRE